MIDLSEQGNFQCFDWLDYPINVVGAYGGLIGSHPVVCGGYPAIDECYKMSARKADFVVKMSNKREFAASVTINSNTLWITGGYDDNTTDVELAELNTEEEIYKIRKRIQAAIDESAEKRKMVQANATKALENRQEKRNYCHIF